MSGNNEKPMEIDQPKEKPIDPIITKKTDNYKSILSKLKEIIAILKGSQKISENKTSILEYISFPEVFPFEKLKNNIYDIFEVKNTKELYDYSRGSAGKLQKILDSSYTEIVKKLDEAIQKTDLLEMNQAIVEIKGNALLKEEIDIILDLLLTKLRLKLEINPLLYLVKVGRYEKLF
jgi:hypothetical protein